LQMDNSAFTFTFC